MTSKVVAGIDLLEQLLREAALAVAEREPNRRAFIDGFNGEPCNTPRTLRKLQWHNSGQRVRDALRARASLIEENRS